MSPTSYATHLGVTRTGQLCRTLLVLVEMIAKMSRSLFSRSDDVHDARSRPPPARRHSETRLSHVRASGRLLGR